MNIPEAEEHIQDLANKYGEEFNLVLNKIINADIEEYEGELSGKYLYVSALKSENTDMFGSCYYDIDIEIPDSSYQARFYSGILDGFHWEYFKKDGDHNPKYKTVTEYKIEAQMPSKKSEIALKNEHFQKMQTDMSLDLSIDPSAKVHKYWLDKVSKKGGVIRETLRKVAIV